MKYQHAMSPIYNIFIKDLPLRFHGNIPLKWEIIIYVHFIYSIELNGTSKFNFSLSWKYPCQKEQLHWYLGISLHTYSSIYPMFAFFYIMSLCNDVTSTYIGEIWQNSPRRRLYTKNYNVIPLLMISCLQEICIRRWYGYCFIFLINCKSKS